MSTATSPDRKRPRTEPPLIVTHDGTFHADEVLACHLLKQLPEYHNAEIVQSRDATVWDTASVLVDVGARYDPANHKYDHHQREFVDTFSPNHKTRLSSAGLIYKHFGKRILAQLLKKEVLDDEVQLVYTKLYDHLIEAFDGIDNGISRYPLNLIPAYKDATTLSSVVSKLNPFWNETDLSPMSQFHLAMSIVGSHFDRSAKYWATSWLPARTIVEKAVRERHTIHSSGQIVLMTEGAPWKDHLDSIESDLGLITTAITSPIPQGTPAPKDIPLYIVFQDPSGQWRIQAVPLGPGTFENRKPLPETWRGLRDEKLDAVTGVLGGIFIHATGFIGGHKTRDGVLQLAQLALTM